MFRFRVACLLRKPCSVSVLTGRASPPGTEWRNYYVVCRTAPSGALWSKCNVFTRRPSPLGEELRHCTMGTYHLSTPVRHVPGIACQLFHTSSSCRAIPAPLLWLLVKPAQRLMVIILGRYRFQNCIIKVLQAMIIKKIVWLVKSVFIIITHNKKINVNFGHNKICIVVCMRFL